FSRPGSAHRILGIPIPTLVLFAPLVVQNILRGTPLAVFADPGVPRAFEPAEGWQLALGDARGSLLDWPRMLEVVGLPADLASIVAVALIAPLVVLALVALFLPRLTHSVPALIMALLGFVTAVLGTHLA